jgi:phosphoglycolate phosphatase
MKPADPASNPLAGVRAVLFDKDGTLLDYWRTWVPINRAIAAYASGGDQALFERILATGGHDPATDQVAAGSLFAGAGFDGIVAHVARVAGTRAPRDLRARVARLFQEGGAANAVLIDGAREAMVALRARGLILGIATNDTAAGLEASLGRFDVIRLCSFTCGCDSGHGAKPAPGMVRAFSAAIGLPPSAIAVVGDSTHDLEMAQVAGAVRVAVLSGTSGRDDLAADADLILQSVRDLPPAFDRQRGQG